MPTSRFDRFAHALVDSASTGPFLQGLLAMKKARARQGLVEPARAVEIARAALDQAAA